MKFAEKIVDAVILAGVKAVTASVINDLQTGVSPRSLEHAALLKETISSVDDPLYIPVAIEVAKAVPLMTEKIPKTMEEMEILNLAGKIFTDTDKTKCPEAVAGCWNRMTKEMGQPTA